MLWLLTLHIAALLIWAAGLVYLPLLIAGTRRDSLDLGGAPTNADSIARWLFTRMASPAAAVAIVAGSAVFLINGTTDLWLMAKLSLVTLLVVAHALGGFLVIRLEAGKSVVSASYTLLASVLLLLAAILWLVLAKPVWGWS
ncbi:CopD family protein [Halopseudomonas salegens]|uniref:Protoporphyrinogen IX oxidase n=1 Tax=Halopseudomonas salegens TaxID=1434072 RepID=A0A1H2I3B9_9GAMM|nr:CopD family protein [Halopseudomonas salegens]SDU38396.1 Uncharacterized membrane protein [Halopseudomonas salegens]